MITGILIMNTSKKLNLFFGSLSAITSVSGGINEYIKK
jgi:hypothetical protein